MDTSVLGAAGSSKMAWNHLPEDHSLIFTNVVVSNLTMSFVFHTSVQEWLHVSRHGFLEMKFKIFMKRQTQNYYNGSAMCERQNTEENEYFSSAESYKITF